MDLKGQINWVLHNGQQILTKATTTTLNLPANYTPAACPSLNSVGPTVTAAFSQPNVAQGAGSGSVTETLTVTVTPSSNPTSTLFNVNVDLSGVAGASTTSPLTPSSIGVPDGNGNLNFQEQITIPTTTAGTLTFPITVLDDAYRGGVNANSATPLNAVVMVGSGCQAPVATAQTLQLGWNSPYSITLAGQLGQNCNSSDTLTYAIQSQPLNGTLSLVSGNSVTYTPNAGFSGLDSFTFNLTDTANSASPLTGAVATVNLVVSAAGVIPVLQLSCPTATYGPTSHGCTTVLTPFVAGTTSISYNGSAIAPTAAGSYPVSASFVSSGSSSQNTSATGALVISQATPTPQSSLPDPFIHRFSTWVHGIRLRCRSYRPQWDNKHHLQRKRCSSDQRRHLRCSGLLCQQRSQLHKYNGYVVADDLRASSHNHCK